MKAGIRDFLFVIIGFLICIIVFGGANSISYQVAIKEDPCYQYNYMDNMRLDSNYSQVFVYCANRELNRTKNMLDFYFRILPKDANFTSQEQIVVDKVKKIINDEFIENNNNKTATENSKISNKKMR
ncbi:MULTISPECIES: hypothetical protein [unclassified Campylobacter]|uniref:hypothetical protein n=1 Tax=unclassified Campylobacter TaxID=2593542 RepID=UPI0022E9CC23|nr:MULTISPECIES: hypothetical protein [unclassified Campylobacter]MDA3042786.1 hypothetical protein [Campylobacter sp. JMF_09 ED2]MDA3044379.1 hypothetical protein [Campylobacter sp. JMF_07 ED4]MDA3063725.1 hypothetical protein [Campylobacter sp. JMF_11 EL3]MDA3071354.1 hypothetical protein [Campylobacter sp. VBCF_03 NA9]MDA3074814.1 hypothetical protein [Campylobacter sp. JMF_05 ED3]